MIATKAESAGDRFRTNNRAGALTFAAATVLLLGITAMASRQPLRPPGPGVGAAAGGGSQVATTSPWELVLIVSGALLALLGPMIYLAWQQRSRTPQPLPAQPRVRVPLHVQLTLVLLLLLVGGLFIAGGLAGARHHALAPRPASLPARAHRSPPVHPPRGRSSFELPWWVPPAVLALMLAAAGVAAVRATARRRIELVATEPRTAGIQLELARALEDLNLDADPRQAVIAAYRRMQQSLSAVGFPRRPAEAPREYMARVSDGLAVDPESLRVLTKLFERAKYSLGPFHAPLRDQAIAALNRLQAELA